VELAFGKKRIPARFTSAVALVPEEESELAFKVNKERSVAAILAKYGMS
jgi:hypothetical protein